MYLCYLIRNDLKLYLYKIINLQSNKKYTILFVSLNIVYEFKS